jgi:hypothetical protein
VVLERGCISDVGNYDELLHKGVEFSRFEIKNPEKSKDKDVKEVTIKQPSKDQDEKAKPHPGQEKKREHTKESKEAATRMITEEEQINSNFSIKTHFFYIKNFGSSVEIILHVIFLLIQEAVLLYGTYCMGVVGFEFVGCF